MALKGTTRIELTNVKTGEKEVIEKDNLVTNAVNDILTLNPYGARFRDYQTYFHPNNETNSTLGSAKYFRQQFLPLCPNLFGGILLYENALEEDATKYFADMDNLLVGYSSNVVNQGEDTKRGSMNQTESGPLDDGTGYRFVFDFATSQGNGTIASLGLTSKMGGVAGYGSTVDQYNNYAFEMDRLSDKAVTYYGATGQVRKNVVSLDLEKNEAIYAYVSGTNTITVGRLKFPAYSIGLRDSYDSYLDNVLYSETIVVTQTFATVVDSTYGRFYGTLIDGGDGYIWGFQHEGNAKGNSEGSATVLWVKISKEDWSVEEGSFVVDAQLEFFGEYNTGSGTYTHSYDKNNLIIKDGILYAIKYCTSYQMAGVYKIPLENPTNITLLEFEEGGTVYYDSAESYDGSYYYANNTTNVNEINGIIRYRSAYINGGILHKASLQQSSVYGFGCLRGCAKPGLKFGPFIFGIGARKYYSGSTSDYAHVMTYLQSCYLATINNLATPVEKTADKTMKITYILREE